ncbi:O-sialoglycoprotein endopeptidase [Tepidamorphus gemmatus]|jgi:N6-L-threonylcarbamoyladenine synthase|uniref:tRNA N6-adenosine threonylcarbamoyltransferase n=2 Tax=Tepidamorphus gemmatus TaxID=747076 RepID=A0A4R3MHB4_9HYPH|nr:O-sialoglycoprotein endopeptidase [Tepidamorphus gemmatus]
MLVGMAVRFWGDYTVGRGGWETQGGVRHGMRVLGIETSCDETAAAVVERQPDGSGRILANVVLSQLEEHAAFGGVVPEIAARAHVEALDRLIAQAMAEAGCGFAGLDGIAATAGPGLIGGLLVGLMTGKAIAAAAGKPLVAVNHLEAHALTARLTDAVAFPYLVLLVTGGHTQIVAVEALGRYRCWGTTIDDAVGEAFDKVAKMLGLGWPGGPAVERQAAEGDPDRFAFPRPLAGRPGCDFSFSGLKTAVRIEAQRLQPLDDRDVADICAGFQAAVVETLADRTAAALHRFRAGYGPHPTLVVAGGVAANQAVRARLVELAGRHDARLFAPPLALCGDNAAMVAWAGAERLAAGLADGMDTPARARWPLEEIGSP